MRRPSPKTQAKWICTMGSMLCFYGWLQLSPWLALVWVGLHAMLLGAAERIRLMLVEGERDAD